MDCAVVEQLVLSTANVAKSRYTIIMLSIIIRLQEVLQLHCMSN